MHSNYSTNVCATPTPSALAILNTRNTKHCLGLWRSGRGCGCRVASTSTGTGSVLQAPAPAAAACCKHQHRHRQRVASTSTGTGSVLQVCRAHERAVPESVPVIAMCDCVPGCTPLLRLHSSPMPRNTGLFRQEAPLAT